MQEAVQGLSVSRRHHEEGERLRLHHTEQVEAPSTQSDCAQGTGYSTNAGHTATEPVLSPTMKDTAAIKCFLPPVKGESCLRRGGSDWGKGGRPGGGDEMNVKNDNYSQLWPVRAGTTWQQPALGGCTLPEWL